LPSAMKEYNMQTQAQHYKSTHCLGTCTKSIRQNTHTVGTGSKADAEMPKYT